MAEIATFSVLGLNVARTSMAASVRTIMDWVTKRERRVVCVANVHMAMEAHDDSSLQRRLNSADMIVPDGMPLVWMSRLRGFREVSRVRGPDLMLELCKEAAKVGIPIGLFGGRSEEQQAMIERYLKNLAPGLCIAKTVIPPFVPLTLAQNQGYVTQFNSAGAQLIFVGIGCPKQENWMLSQRHDLQATTIGVGAAFDLFAGITRNAPLWMQALGLEWLFRLATEPRRLWKRYLKHNPRFVAFALWEFVRYKR